MFALVVGGGGFVLLRPACYICSFCFGGCVCFVVFDVLCVFVLLLLEVCLFCCV